MAKTTRILAMTLVAAMALMGSSRRLAAQEQGALRVTVHVRNSAQVPEDILAASESAVTAIFAKAGIEARFVDSGAQLTIVLLTRDTAEKMHQVPDAFGFAPGSKTARGTIAYVLQPRVDRIADGYTAPRSIVLAAAMVHEVGHLLMFNAHSSTGVMRADWNQADFRQAVHGHLLFTAEQAATMRTRLDKFSGEQMASVR